MHPRYPLQAACSFFGFIISNTLVNIPFIFACTMFFALICYWAIVGLNSGGTAFFRFVFLAILAAESQVLVIAALLVFVAALAIGALCQ
jgi:hypothetical protein